MASIQGPGGAVALPTGFTINASSWTADLAIETTDTSGFGDDGYRVREPVIISMDGTVTGAAIAATAPVLSTVLAATADPSGAQGTMTLTAESGNLYTFTGTINNMSMTRPVDGHCEITFSFQSSGQITQTWS